MTNHDSGRERAGRGDEESRQQRTANGPSTPDSGPESRLEASRDPPRRRLGDLDERLAAQDYPATGAELVRAVGDGEVESKAGTRRVDDVLAPFEGETFGSADEVRGRVLDRLGRR